MQEEDAAPPSRMRLVGISGFRGAGKDTVYELIAQECDNVVRRAFADKLKVIAGRSLGYEGEDVEIITAMNLMKNQGFVDSVISSGVGTHLSGRRYLQLFGQRAREVFGHSFWVDQVLPDPALNVESPVLQDKLARRFDRAHVGVVTDVRYPGEAWRIRALGGEVWAVERPDVVSDGHDSERPLKDSLIDGVIINDGSKEDLRVHVRRLLDV
jgi:hypothetical protein